VTEIVTQLRVLPRTCRDGILGAVGSSGAAASVTGPDEPTALATLGRQREIAALTAMLGQAAAGSGSALVLRGEAGIGKTTLLAAAQRLAAEREMRTLACSGVRTEAHLPFAGLHQLLRPVLAMMPAIPPEQGDLLRAALGLDQSVLADLYRVALAALELLAVVAARTPLLVVADDAHWLDRASADVLAFVGRRIAAEPIAMILSSRNGTDDPFEAAAIPELAIGALDPASSAALLDRVAPRLRDEVRGALLADAAGNPLALVELPAARRAADLWPAADSLAGPLPVGDLLRRSFTTRLSELPGRTQTLLLVASADAGCSLGELARAAGIVRGSPVDEADIQPAIDARLVRLAGDKVAFSHPLIAAAIYQSAPVAARQQIHRALAEVLPAGEDRRVWHRAAAALGPDDGVAGELAALADQAARRGAVAASIAALDRASSLVTDKARQTGLLLRASECAVELGRGRLALELMSRADASQLEPFAEARMLIIEEGVHPGEAGNGVPDFVAAARAVAAADTDLAASVLWTAASRCWWISAEPDDRLQVVAATEALGLPVTDPRRIAILSYTVTADRRPQLHADLLQASADRTDLTSLRLIASAAANLGDHALAVQLFAAAVRLARRQGRLGIIARLQALQAWSSLWSGDLDSAAMLADETERLASEQNQPMWHGAATLELTLVDALRGDYADAEKQLWPHLASKENRQVRLYHAMALYALSVAALGVGRYQDAYQYLRRIVDPADDVFHYGACQWVIGDLAEAALGAGHLEATAELLRGLAADLRDHPTPAVRYSVLYADAILADEDTSPARFAVALAADPGGSVLAQARLRLAYGGWLRRRRSMREAREVLADAQARFAELGASGFAYRAARELRAAGGAGERQGRDVLARLTPQELQIAQLAAEGLSNRQIGEQLFLSHRTVGSHLYHLFPKLGITTRSQLANVLTSAPGPASGHVG
jgi:DNA-binding CsgD family transcriptional regulator